MSWRTQGHYRGLGNADLEWLRGFDKDWDTKAQGRSSQDALDRANYSRLDAMIPCFEVSGPTEHAFALEVKLTEVAGRISRFTIPKRRQYGWVIFLILKGGKRCRSQFKDKYEALQAYLTLQELYVNILIS